MHHILGSTSPLLHSLCTLLLSSLPTTYPTLLKTWQYHLWTLTTSSFHALFTLGFHPAQIDISFDSTNIFKLASSTAWASYPIHPSILPSFSFMQYSTTSLLNLTLVCPAHFLPLDPASKISQTNSPSSSPMPHYLNCHSPQKPLIIYQAGHNVHPELDASHSSQPYY